MIISNAAKRVMEISVVSLTAVAGAFAQGAGGEAAASLIESPFILAGLVSAGALTVGLLYWRRPTAKAGLNSRKKAVAGPAVSESAAPQRTIDPLRSPLNPKVLRDSVFETAQSIRANSEQHVPQEVEVPLAQILEFGSLPMSRFDKIKPIAAFEPLRSSSDAALRNAIEILLDEESDDAEERLLALRIAATFKTVEAVEALSQVALYDLSVHIRAKAVTILADFDHESVFEPMVLACADLSREVRATAARGLFNLSFDRADAWARLATSSDSALIQQAAHAAVEAGLAQKSFDRLVNRDGRIAYEAFTMSYLLAAAGNTEPIFEAIRKTSDVKVKMALLQVIKVAGSREARTGLNDFIAEGTLPAELRDRAREAAFSYA